jgi:iron complex outermembrane receptor protein
MGIRAKNITFRDGKMRSFGTKYLGCLLLTSCLSPAAFAQAQSGSEPQTEDAAPNDEIIVTAQRKSESLQDVPIAITAFSQEALTQKSIFNPFELSKAVPGLNTVADQANGSLPQFTIRGRGQSYGAASGSVETYFADVPWSPPFQSPTLPPQFFDLQSVQVLKGPQGTLFGRNSTGGAVLFVPQAPTDTFEGYVRAQGGNYGNVQVEGAINVPLSDNAALRVAGFLWRRDGYAKTIAGTPDVFGTPLPSQDTFNQDVTEFRATLLLNPTDALTNSTILTYHTSNNRGSLQAQFYANPDVAGVTQAPIPAAVATPGITPRLFYSNVDLNHQPNKVWAIINTTTLELNDNISVKNIFSHIRSQGTSANPSDYDGSGIGFTNPLTPTGPFVHILQTGLGLPRVLHNRQTTNELQLQGSAFDGKIDFIVGGLLDLTRQPGGLDDINFFNLTYSALNVPDPINHSFTQSTFTSKSVFGSATWYATDRLSFSGGARHTWDDVTHTSYNFLAPVVTSSVIPGTPKFTDQTKFKGWTYNAGFNFQPSSDTTVYGGYRHGYKRGGFNLQAGVNGGNAFGPETNDDFYFGIKQNLNVFGVPGRVNIEGFYDIYKDQQRYYLGIDPVFGLVSIVTNAEKSTYKGIDFDFSIDPTDWLSLSGNYTFVDGKYNKFTDPSDGVSDLSVNPISFINKNKLSATARFHTELSDGGEIAFAPTINYQSKSYSDDFSRRIAASYAAITAGFLGNPGQINLAAQGLDTVPAYTTVDLRLEWNKVMGSNFDLAANVNNLTDKTYPITVNGLYNLGVQAVIYGPPRMLTVDVRYRF